MKILYGIQCTGNGHITRSIDLVNELKKYAQVDVLTSGTHSEVSLPFGIKYPLKGLAYYFGRNGSFDVVRTLFSNNFFRFMKEVNDLPIEEYNLVISDFEPISSWSARKKKVYSVALSNQASLVHPKVPKPKTVNPISKWIIKSFCPSNAKYGLFYSKFDSSLFYPPIRKEVKDLTPTSGDYYVVYLPFYGDDRIVEILGTFSNTTWKVFSKHATTRKIYGNVDVRPISDKTFLKAIEHCKGVLCSAGFGTTSEALYLKKKLLVIPMKSQYEQLCNAHALEQFGVPSIRSLNHSNLERIGDWLAEDTIPEVHFRDEKRSIVQKILTDYISHVETTA